MPYAPCFKNTLYQSEVRAGGTQKSKKRYTLCFMWQSYQRGHKAKLPTVAQIPPVACSSFRRFWAVGCGNRNAAKVQRGDWGEKGGEEDGWPSGRKGLFLLPVSKIQCSPSPPLSPACLSLCSSAETESRIQKLCGCKKKFASNGLLLSSGIRGGWAKSERNSTPLTKKKSGGHTPSHPGLFIYGYSLPIFSFSLRRGGKGRDHFHSD